jgi:hypothetical protein
MKAAIYQIGVDVLGFPIYVEHHIYQGVEQRGKFNTINLKWLKVIQKIIKQH